MSTKKKKKKSSVKKRDGGVISIQGNVSGSNIVTGNNNVISLESNKQEYILRKVEEELSHEGEDINSVSRKTFIAIYELTSRLAKRLRITHEAVLSALRELGARI